ncbi:ImmA/IrrE family metallo-endopeptidase [Ralstonia solanacearum]|uniref:ImmA/IrrE family metallo-endopeptidase n=1 Tax=Ralstonia solanacearum TaxID=305 RepID=UPI003513D02A
MGARQLAAHLGIRVWTPDNVPGLSPETRQVLLRNDGTPSCWSAVTLVVGEKTLVILNSSHSPARQASDLMHELAHRIRNHEPEEMSISSEGLMLLKAYDKEQEEEADWLAGVLLLPRDALVQIRRQGTTDEDVVAQYGVSKRMYTYRVSMTGVNRQFR